MANSTRTHYSSTFIQLLHISLHFFNALVNLVEGCQSNISRDFSPWRDLVEGALRTACLGWFHGAGSGKLVVVLLGMLHVCVEGREGEARMKGLTQMIGGEHFMTVR